MKRTFYIGMKICGYYAIFINDNGYEQEEMVQENDFNGFIQCLEILGYEEL